MKIISFLDEQEFIKNVRDNNFVNNHIIFVFRNKTCARGLIESMSNPGLHAGFDLIVSDYFTLDLQNYDFSRFSLLIKTGVKWSCPAVFGNHLKVAPRSGLSLKTPIRLANAVGTVEASYRNDIGVLIDIIPLITISNKIKDDYEFKYVSNNGEFKLTKDIVEISKGFKIAQAIPVTDRVYPVIGCISENIYEDFVKLVPSVRGESGYGSTD